MNKLMNVHHISFYSGKNGKTGIRFTMDFYCHFTFQLNEDACIYLMEVRLSRQTYQWFVTNFFIQKTGKKACSPVCTSHLVHQYKDYILTTVLERMKTRMLLEEMKYGIVRGVSYGILQ